MSEEFLRLPPSDQAEILQTSAAQLGRRAEYLEKDVWICWVLQHLFTMPGALPMAFKGGTSLSKVFDVIHRFSEDVDITIDYRALDRTLDPFAPGISKTAQKQLSELLKGRLTEHTHSVILPFFENLLAPFTKHEQSIQISEDGESMRILYPSVFEKGETVLVEFGGRNVIEPHEQHSIHPLIAEKLTALVFPSAKVSVLSPTRTFWEKATLIHVECSRPEPRMDANRLSRHWSDLAMLADHAIGKKALADRNLLADVVKHKKVFFYTAHANYEACLTRGMQLVPGRALAEALRADYEQMIQAGMFDAEPPKFDQILKRLRTLEMAINAVGRDGGG